MAMRIRGRDMLEKPTCPFCGMLIERPVEEPDLTLNEMPVGKCDCGAVYACDVTGHNLGTALTEALIYGCKGNWDLAWDLDSEYDYLQEEIKSYDYEDHLVVHGTMHKGRKISGVLYFIKLREGIMVESRPGDIQESGPRTHKPRIAGSTHEKRRSSKREVEAMVKKYQVGPLLAIAREDKRIIRDLQRLIYSVDILTRWRATDLLGQAAAQIAKYDPRAVSKLMNRLFSSVVDTAASSWGAIDAIGDIIAHNPEDFGGYLPRLFGLATDHELLPDLLRNFAKIAKQRPDLLRSKAYAFIPLLTHQDPEVRAYSAELLGAVKAHEARQDLENLVDDDAQLQVYRDGTLHQYTVGKMALEALDRL